VDDGLPQPEAAGYVQASEVPRQPV